VIVADVPWAYEIRKEDSSHRAVHAYPGSLRPGKRLYAALRACRPQHRANGASKMKRTLIGVIVLIALMAAAKLHRHVLNAPQGPNMPVPEHDTDQKDEDMPPGPP